MPRQRVDDKQRFHDKIEAARLDAFQRDSDGFNRSIRHYLGPWPNTQVLADKVLERKDRLRGTFSVGEIGQIASALSTPSNCFVYS